METGSEITPEAQPAAPPPAATAAATAPPTVKGVKKALGDYIRFVNANPDVLAKHFAEDKAGHLDARAALKELRGAWQPLKQQTPAPKLYVALEEIKTKLHSRLNFQWTDQPAAHSVTGELDVLWSQYANACRSLRMQTQIESTQAVLNHPDFDVAQHIVPIDQMCKEAAGPAVQAVSEARRAEAQAARIDAAQEEMLNAFDEGELSEEQLPSGAAISTANPAELGAMIKSWAVVHTQIGFWCLQRLCGAATAVSFSTAGALQREPPRKLPGRWCVVHDSMRPSCDCLTGVVGLG